MSITCNAIERSRAGGLLSCTPLPSAGAPPIRWIDASAPRALLEPLWLTFNWQRPVGRSGAMCAQRAHRHDSQGHVMIAFPQRLPVVVAHSRPSLQLMRRRVKCVRVDPLSVFHSAFRRRPSSAAAAAAAAAAQRSSVVVSSPVPLPLSCGCGILNESTERRRSQSCLSSRGARFSQRFSKQTHTVASAVRQRSMRARVVTHIVSSHQSHQTNRIVCVCVRVS